MKIRWLLLVAVLMPLLPARGEEQPAVWKTAWVKRGFVGDFKIEWGGGPGATQRMRTPLAVDGTQVKVFLHGSFADEVTLSRMVLQRGRDDQGNVEGNPFPVTFEGAGSLTMKARSKPLVSDALSIPVKRGTWYLDDTYTSPTFPYAYEVDAGWWHREGDKPGRGELKARTGLTRRIDVLTTDRRPLLVCYGDSITHGFGSTPNTASRYPDVLSKLIDQPVLNMGVNADLMGRNRHAFLEIRELAGVEQVIFLLGINDIILGQGIKSEKEYAEYATANIDELHRRKIKVIWGTIPPSGGFPAFDKDPARETLRQAINQWIRTSQAADAIADFDKALADPKEPTRLRADCHSGDWLHPNDKGYGKMAQAAAEAVQKMRGK